MKSFTGQADSPCSTHYTYIIHICPFFPFAFSHTCMHAPLYLSVSLQLIGRSLELRLLLHISYLSAFSYRATPDSPTWQPWVKDARCFSNFTAAKKKLFTHCGNRLIRGSLTLMNQKFPYMHWIHWIGHFRSDCIDMSQTLD